jgi:hypothetical protein
MTGTQAFRNALHVPTDDPTVPGRAVTVTTPGDEYVSAWLTPGGVPEAPIDGKLYGRKNETWALAANQTPLDLLNAIKTVDGAGSGLDADFLDGINSTGFAAATHGHVIADVTGLQTALDGKAAASHTHSYSSLTGIPATFAPAAHSHPQSDVTSLVADLAAKAPIASPAFTGTPTTATTPTAGDSSTKLATTAFVANAVSVVGGVSPSNTAPGMDGTAAAGSSALYSRGDHVHPTDTSRAPVSHTHTTAQVTGLDTALAGKAPTVHSHVTADVTGLDTALGLLAPKASPIFTGTVTLPPTVIASGTNGSVRLHGGSAVGLGGKIQMFGEAHASFANRNYYDASLHSFRDETGAGSQMTYTPSTGVLIVPGAPTSGTHAANKTYVDAQDALSPTKADPAFSGTMTLGGPNALVLGQWLGDPIDTLLGTSTAGGAFIEGNASGNITIGLRDNDATDCFGIVSYGNGAAPYAKMAMKVTRDGIATFGGSVASSQDFFSTTATMTLQTTGVGNIYMRPNGNSTNQTRFWASGDVTFSGAITFPSSTCTSWLTATNGFTSPTGGNYVGSTTAVYLGTAAGGSGSVVLRPVAYNSATNQTVIDANGDMTVGGIVTAASGLAATAGNISQVAAGAYMRAGGNLIARCASAVPSNATAGVVFNENNVAYFKNPGTAATQFVSFCNNATVTSTEIGSIKATNATTVAYNTTSDENLKTFTGPLDGQRAIDLIRADPAREFDWNASGEHAVGWGAQTSHALSPDLATPPPPWVPEADDPDNPEIRGIKTEPLPGEPGYQPWGMDLSKRTPYLWAALAKALDDIDDLKARLAALESVTAH